jgi:hypothetical protein
MGLLLPLGSDPLVIPVTWANGLHSSSVKFFNDAIEPSSNKKEAGQG